MYGLQTVELFIWNLLTLCVFLFALNRTQKCGHYSTWQPSGGKLHVNVFCMHIIIHVIIHVQHVYICIYIRTCILVYIIYLHVYVHVHVQCTYE